MHMPEHWAAGANTHLSELDTHFKEVGALPMDVLAGESAGILCPGDAHFTYSVWLGSPPMVTGHVRLMSLLQLQL